MEPLPNPNRTMNTLAENPTLSLALPPVETAPTDPDGRRAYLDALRAGDAGDLLPLQQQWIDRLAAAI